MKTISKKATGNKIMDIKARLAAKKAAVKEEPKVEPKTKKIVGKKKEDKKIIAGGRGRPKGVKYVVPDNFQEIIETQFSSCEDSFKSLDLNINKFIESGNKSAAKNARAALQDFIKMAKNLRKSLQEAKGSLKQEAA